MKKTRKGCGGNDLQKRKVLSLERKSEGVMDDESGESMEPMEEVRPFFLQSKYLWSRLVSSPVVGDV